MTPLRVLSDENLARLAAAGNSNAFAVLYERHRDGLLRYCHSITRNREHAADALQSTMVKALAALRNGSSTTAPSQLRAWLFRIAHNESITVLRQHRPSVDIDEVLDRGTDPSPETRGRLRELLEDLGRLTDRRRAALLMRELAGLSYEEIAAALRCSEAAVRQSVFEARAALTDLAEGRDSSCDTIRHKISDGDRRLLRARRVRAHLNACTPCREFDAAVSRQRSGLASLFPLLPAGGAAATLNAILAAAGGSGAGAVAVGGGAVGGSALAGLGVKSAIAGVATLAAAGAVAVESNRIDLGGRLSGNATEGIADGTRAGDAARALAVGDAARSVAPSPKLAATEPVAAHSNGSRAATVVSDSAPVSDPAEHGTTSPEALAPVGGADPIPGESDPVVVSTHPDQPPSTGSDGPASPGSPDTGTDTDSGSAPPASTPPPATTTSSSNPGTQLMQGAQQLVEAVMSTAARVIQQAQQWSGGWSGGSSYGD